jgi:hypothetical protein
MNRGLPPNHPSERKTIDVLEEMVEDLKQYHVATAPRQHQATEHLKKIEAGLSELNNKVTWILLGVMVNAAVTVLVLLFGFRFVR